MYPFDAISNFGYGAVTTAPSPATTGTSLKVAEAIAANFPDPATAGQYNVTVWPTGVQPIYSNSEIIRITAKAAASGGEVELTIDREEESTPARTIIVGDQIALTETILARNQIFNAIISGFYEDKLLAGQSFSKVTKYQFKTPGNKTTYYIANRLIKFHDGSLAIVLSSSYSAPDTTVNIIIGSGLVPDSPTNVYISGPSKSKILDYEFSKRVHHIYTVGDSLTVAGEYQTQLETLLGSSWKTHIGWGGIASGVLSRLNIDALDNPDAEYIVVWVGINDIVADTSAATIESDLQSIYSAAHAAGLKVIAVNISPFKTSASWTSGRQTVLDAVNTWIANTATDIDHVIDVYSILEDPGAADTLLATYDYGDHVHLTTDGYNEVAAAIFNEVDWILGDFGTLDQESFSNSMFPHSISRQGFTNANFDIWLNGNSFTNPASGSITANGAYLTIGMASPPTNVIHSKQVFTPGELFNAQNFYRIAPDGAGFINNGEYYFISKGVENGLKYLAGQSKKVTVSFWARSSISGKRIALELRQVYGSGGSPSTGEVIKGPIITLTTTLKKYTHTFIVNTLNSKTFGTNDNDGFGLNIWVAWGSDMPATYFSTGTGSETFGGAGTIDLSKFNFSAGEYDYGFQPKSFAQEFRDSGGNDLGWNVYRKVIPTLGTADDPIFPLVFAGVDLTSILWPGMKVRWTQNGTVRYGIIHAVAFSTNTTIQVYGGSDYNVDNSTTYPISDFYYSPAKAPKGFPLDPTKWDYIYSNTGDIDIGALTNPNWGNFFSVAVPIGIWLPEYSCCFEPYDTATTYYSVWSTLSTANNSESDIDATYFTNGPVVATPYIAMGRKKSAPIILAAKTTYYFNGKASRNTSQFLIRGGTIPTKLVFRNVYL